MGTDAETDYMVETRGNGSPVKRLERSHLIVALSCAGYTNHRIATYLEQECDPPVKMSPIQVGATIIRYLDSHVREQSLTTEQLRALENQRLDDLWLAYYQRAVGLNPDTGEIEPERADAKAAQLCLKVAERRAKINGLDAPHVMEHRGAVRHLHELGIDPEEIERTQQAFIDSGGQGELAAPEVIDVDVLEEGTEAVEAEAQAPA